MPITVSIRQAKPHFSKLLSRVVNGEEIIIAKAGKPIARIVRAVEMPAQRVVGGAKGRVIIAPDFDAPLPESILKAFEK